MSRISTGIESGEDIIRDIPNTPEGALETDEKSDIILSF